MKHICFCLFIILIQSYNLFSQDWEWATSSGTANADITVDHYTDLYGYSYLACVQSGGIAVKKVDPSGSLLWTASAGLGSPAGITVNKNGFVFITGFFSGSTNIGGTILTDLSGGQEGFIAALDEDGSWQWAVQFGSSTGDDHGAAIDIDHNTNDLVVTGAFEDSAYFDTVGVFAMWDQDMFIARYSENGNCIWVNTAGDFGPQEGIDVKTDQLGFSYVTGEYIDDIVFGPDVLPFSGPGGKDVFIAKADPFGNFIWGNRVHGTNNNIWSHALALDPAFGGCYVHGRYSGSTTFPNGVTYPDPMGIFPFITKVDSVGNGIWNFRYGFGSDPGAIPTPSDITLVGDSIFYSGGFYSQGTCDIDGFTLASNGWYDLYIGVMDQGQNTSRVIQLTDGSGSSDGGGFLTSDLAGALIVSGTFNANSSIGGLPIPNVGIQDNFIAKEGCVFNAELSSIGLNFCQGDSVLLVAAPAGAYNYQWYVDGAQISINNDSLYFSTSKPV
jgi:hypothetical protein